MLWLSRQTVRVRLEWSVPPTWTWAEATLPLFTVSSNLVLKKNTVYYIVYVYLFVIEERKTETETTTWQW